MLNVTPQAISELHGMLMRTLGAEPPADASAVGFRLVRGAGGDGASSSLALALDEPREGDHVVEHEGCSVLILDAPTSSLLDDLTLDVVETPDGTRLTLRE